MVVALKKKHPYDASFVALFILHFLLILLYMHFPDMESTFVLVSIAVNVLASD